jgi:hypothetical protein
VHHPRPKSPLKGEEISSAFTLHSAMLRRTRTPGE